MQQVFVSLKSTDMDTKVCVRDSSQVLIKPMFGFHLRTPPVAPFTDMV